MERFSDGMGVAKEEEMWTSDAEGYSLTLRTTPLVF